MAADPTHCESSGERQILGSVRIMAERIMPAAGDHLPVRSGGQNAEARDRQLGALVRASADRVALRNGWHPAYPVGSSTHASRQG
jgi:hypothetical protein